MFVNGKGKKYSGKKRKNGKILITAALTVCMLTACGFGGKGSSKEPASTQNQTVTQQSGSQQGGSQKSEPAVSENSIVNFQNEKGFVKLREDMKNGDIPIECNVLYDEEGSRPDVTVTDQETIRNIYGQLADITVGDKTDMSVTDSYHHITFRLRNDTYVSFYFEGEDIFCCGEDNYTVSGSRNLWNTVRQLQDVAIREKQNQTRNQTQTADQSQSQQSGTSKTGGTKEGTKDGTKAENSSDKDSTKENRVTGDISDETKEGKDVSTSGTGQITGVGKAAPEEAQTAGTGTGVSGENDGHSAAGDGGSSGSYTGLQENKGTDIASETPSGQETDQHSGISGQKSTETGSNTGTSSDTDTQTGSNPAGPTDKAGTADTTEVAGTAGIADTAEAAGTAGTAGIAGTADTAATAAPAQELADPALNPAMEAAYTEIVRAYAKVLKVDRETFMELFSQGYYSPQAPDAGTTPDAEPVPDAEAASDAEPAPDAEAASDGGTASDAEAASVAGLEADTESAPDAEPVPDASQAPAYDERINYEMFLDMYTDAVPGEVMYGLHDYNADGVQELVIAVGDGERRTVRAMYTFDGSKAVSLFTGDLTPAYRVDIFLQPDSTFLVHASGGAMSGGDTICRIADDRSGLKIIAEYEYDAVKYGNMDRHSKTGEVIKEEDYNGEYGTMDTPDKGVSFTPVNEEAQVTLPAAAEKQETDNTQP